MSNILHDPRSTEANEKQASVYFRDAFHTDEQLSTYLKAPALTRVGIANSAIQSIVALLIDRELTMDSDNGTSVLSCDTTLGLLHAIACCAEFSEIHATGGKALWSTSLSDEKESQANAFIRDLDNGRVSYGPKKGGANGN